MAKTMQKLLWKQLSALLTRQSWIQSNAQRRYLNSRNNWARSARPRENRRPLSITSCFYHKQKQKDKNRVTSKESKNTNLLSTNTKSYKDQRIVRSKKRRKRYSKRWERFEQKKLSRRLIPSFGRDSNNSSASDSNHPYLIAYHTIKKAY